MLKLLVISEDVVEILNIQYSTAQQGPYRRSDNTLLLQEKMLKMIRETRVSWRSEMSLIKALIL